MNKEIEEIKERLPHVVDRWQMYQVNGGDIEDILSKIFTLEEKVRELETDDKRKSEKFMEIVDKYESLKFKMFDLEEQLRISGEERDGYKNGQMQLQQMVNDLMDVNAKWASKVKKLQEVIEKHRNTEIGSNYKIAQMEIRDKEL